MRGVAVFVTAVSFPLVHKIFFKLKLCALKNVTKMVTQSLGSKSLALADAIEDKKVSIFDIVKVKLPLSLTMYHAMKTYIA
jgi:hypothetical protein